MTLFLRFSVSSPGDFVKLKQEVFAMKKNYSTEDLKKLIIASVESISDTWILEQIYRCIINITEEEG